MKQQDQGEEEKEDEAGQSKEQSTAPKPNPDGKKPDEKPSQGESSASSKNKTQAPKPESSDPLFGGSSGANTSFENSAQEQQGDGEAPDGGEQGGMANANDVKTSSADMPSQAPERAGNSGQSSNAPPEKSDKDGDREQRELQKVDILRDAA